MAVKKFARPVKLRLEAQFDFAETKISLEWRKISSGAPYASLLITMTPQGLCWLLTGPNVSTTKNLKYTDTDPSTIVRTFNRFGFNSPKLASFLIHKV